MEEIKKGIYKSNEYLLILTKTKCGTITHISLSYKNTNYGGGDYACLEYKKLGLIGLIEDKIIQKSKHRECRGFII